MTLFFIFNLLLQSKDPSIHLVYDQCGSLLKKKLDFIPQDCYTGKSITLDSYDGKKSQSHPLALVDLEVGQVKGLFEVAVAIFFDHYALLGRDLGIDSVLQLACDVRMASNNLEQPRPELRQPERQLSRKPMTVPQLTSVSDSPVDTVAMSRVESPTLGSVDVSNQEDSVDPDFHPRTLENSMKDLVEPELPIPPLTAGMTSCASLIDEQKNDDSLKSLHEKAADSITRYRYIDGFLVQEELNELGDSVQRIVVPSGRRKKVLETAHSTVSAGHFDRKKTGN